MIVSHYDIIGYMSTTQRPQVCSTKARTEVRRPALSRTRMGIDSIIESHPAAFPADRQILRSRRG